MQGNGKSGRGAEQLLKLRDAALQLGISFPTIKQWIYKRKIRSIQTAGGHHRIPQSEVDKLLFRTRGKTEKEAKAGCPPDQWTQSASGTHRIGSH